MRRFRTADRTVAATPRASVVRLTVTALMLALALFLLAGPVSAQEASAQEESVGTPPPLTEPGIPQFATQAPSPPAPASDASSTQDAPLAVDDIELAGEETADQADAAPSAAPSGPAHDLSPWGMYEAADIVVKGVMIGLVIASFLTWIVWAAKSVELWGARRRLKGAIRRISASPDLTAAVQTFARRGGTGGALVRAAGEELARSLPVLDPDDRQGVKERVASRLSRIEANAGRRITFGTGVLATIGATAPFVGLFGTVWGIMNSFIGIAESQTTNLAVVAPGIAEALLATALGLVAAIPAVMIYNAFARSIAGYRLLLADASASVERLVSWELRSGHGVRLAQAAE